MPVPAKKTPTELKSLARAYTDVSMRTLGAWASEETVDPEIRIRAIGMLLDRGWGKPAQTHEHTGADGANAIEVTIRTIVEGKK